MAWVLVGWAHQFRAELAAIAPNRDKASDGSIGDTAHQGSPSGHNPDDTPGSRPERNDADNIPEVRAIDVDTDLRVPGLTMQMVVAYLVGRCRSGLERRLIYIIYNGVIWSAGSGWQARRYTGSNPHDKHAHLSGHPDYDDDRRPFGLASLIQQQEDDDMTPSERWVQHVINYRVEALRANRATIKIPARPDLGPDYKAYTEPNLLAAALAEAKARDAAILAAVSGVDHDAVLAAVEKHGAEIRADLRAAAAEDAARDAAMAQKLDDVASGKLTAEQALAELRELLPVKAGTEQPA